MVNHNIILSGKQQSKYIRSEWIRASVVSPCPVCGKPDNCQVSRSGEVALCGRVSAGSKGKPNNGKQYLHILSEGPQRSGYIHPSHSSPPVIPFDQSVVIRASKDPKLAELAELLGVSVVALQDLGVGHLYSGAWCWSFPERDAAGEVIGINRRYLDGQKKSLGRRGITYADGWDRGGPILLVEGGSDTAALLTMGLSVIGRPSNLGGVDMLAEMLAAVPRDRLVVVVAEDDYLKNGKPRKTHATHPAGCACGQCWPGRFGAEQTAAGLSERLGRPVCWSLPPDGAKDSREWLRAHGANGHRFLTGLLESIVTVEPSEEPDWNSPPVVSVAVDGRRVASMDEVQSVMREARTNSINRPGVYLDRSGTGTGKTHLSAEMVATAADVGQRVAVLVPTHANAVEWVDMVEKLGRGRVRVGKYPQRVIGDEPLPGAETNPETLAPNCWNREADLAQSLGLSVGSAVCQGCPYRAKCEAVGYLAELNESSKLQVKIMTHGRGAVQSLEAVAGDCGLVIIDENPLSLLRPHEAASVEELETAADLLLEVLTDPHELDLIGDASNHDDQYRFITHLLNIVEACQRSVSAADGRAAMVPPPVSEWVAADGRRGIPAGVQSRLFRNMKSRKKLTALWKILFAGAMGGQLSVTRSIVPAGRGPGGILKTAEIVQLHSVTDNPLPVGAVVWLQDGTADPELIRACLPGRDVIDVTPDVVPVSLHKVTQHPRDITRQTSTDVVVKVILGLLADNPHKMRVGLIGHHTHLKALQELKSKDGRIVRVSYYGSGLDVASNCWLEDGCDLIIDLGTPRVNGAAVQSVLVQAGQLAAAGEDGAWGEFRWSGKTESGEPVGVMSRGYDHPAWKRAHRHLVRSRMIQAVGRGRAACEGGCDVIVVSTEECGLAVTDLASVPMNETEKKVLAALVPKSDHESAHFPIKRENRSVIGKGADSRSLLKPAEIVKKTGLSDRSVRKYLVRLEQRGLVISLGKRGWCLVKPPEVQESPQSAENEPVASKLVSQSRVESTRDDEYDQSVAPPDEGLEACQAGISGSERWESQRRERSEL